MYRRRGGAEQKPFRTECFQGRVSYRYRAGACKTGLEGTVLQTVSRSMHYRGQGAEVE